MTAGQLPIHVMGGWVGPAFDPLGMGGMGHRPGVELLGLGGEEALDDVLRELLQEEPVALEDLRHRVRHLEGEGAGATNRGRAVPTPRPVVGKTVGRGGRAGVGPNVDDTLDNTGGFRKLPPPPGGELKPQMKSRAQTNCLDPLPAGRKGSHHQHLGLNPRRQGA